MNVLYVSSACYKNNIDDYNKILNNKLSYAHVKFHNLIIDGLIYNDCNVTYLIGLPVSKHEKLIWKQKTDHCKKGKYIQFGFINIPLLKQTIISIKMYFNIKKWLKKNNTGLVILDMTYATVVPFVINLFRNFKGSVIGIAPDIYEYMADVNKITPQKPFVSQIMKKRLVKAYQKMDGYVFLTEQMNDVINVNNKPYMIIEGLVEKENSKIIDYKNREKIILYAGGLSKRFGVLELIESFEKIKGAKLYLYGSGELEELIKKKSEKNKNIVFWGSCPNKDVVKMEKRSYILVNPRGIDEYTKYSFPSKLMEYLLSGTVVLTTKLPGIPKEYDDYLIYIKDLKKDLENILNKDLEELNKIGSANNLFVNNKKNNIVQAKKIIDFGGKI